ncbi:hypothetical protein K431DRAFT_259744 [Polychaeton citri CBS 116435]|uniref:Azaphilone pigments biosynthesis cluster protein L N-terminal domain-containing protein n=1 Tax=Polychaeton citri CBS 116435 TaxID=1314669 RepID=A0A9P4URR2_9PEZI|nr:hypothetical protein K431DRAFT_259744 [Polychaeton citri CBS 116435]
MADPLSISTGIVSLVVPALHGARLLLTDVHKIIDAPEAIGRLGEDVDSVYANLTVLQNIEAPVWDSLGTVVAEHAKATITSCKLACDTIRLDIQQWTGTSPGENVSWRDRVTVGFFKEHHLRAASSQMQTHKLTLGSLVGTATLYSSLRGSHLTEDLRSGIVSQQNCTVAAIESIQTQVAVVERSLAEVRSSSSESSANEEDVDMEAAIGQIEELMEVLQSSQTLLRELLSKYQTKDIEKVCAANRPTQITFGRNYRGMQMGINHGSITWNSDR